MYNDTFCTLGPFNLGRPQFQDSNTYTKRRKSFGTRDFLIVSDPQWPSYWSFNITFKHKTLAETEELRVFLNDNLGKVLRYNDYNNVAYDVIVTEPITITDYGFDCKYGYTLTMEGVRAN